MFLEDFERMAQAAPDKAAIVDTDGEITYGRLRELSVRCAHHFTRLGIAKGDVISIQLPNERRWAIAHLAALRIGAVTNPLVPIYRERELTHMLRVAGSKLLLIPARYRGFDYLAMARRLQATCPALRYVVCTADADAAGVLSWADLTGPVDPAATEAASAMERSCRDSDISEIIFTSGTTGEAKGVLHTDGALTLSQSAMIEVLRLTPDDVLHATSTFGHQTGFLGGLRLPFQLGATVVYQESWSAETFCSLVERHRVTLSTGSSTFLRDIVNSPALGKHDMSSLRIFRCGGAPIPRPLVREAKTRLPHVVVHSAWGQTENAVVTMTRPGDAEEKIVETDGCPQPGMQIRVVDADNRPVVHGTEGKLQCRGPFLFVGYAKRPDLYEESFVDGWFETGDLATIDAEGYVRITGRVKDIIIRGGENIPVAYVENALHEDPRVIDVAIVAMPDERLGERACAFVIPREGTDLKLGDLQQTLGRLGVAKQFWPERLELVASLPRAPNGKVRKAELRAHIARRLTAAAGGRG